MSDEAKKATEKFEEFSKSDREIEAIKKLNEMGCLTISFEEYEKRDFNLKFERSDEDIKKVMKIIEDFKDTKILTKKEAIIEHFLSSLINAHPDRSIRGQAKSILGFLKIRSVKDSK